MSLDDTSARNVGIIRDIGDLEAVYGQPSRASLAKEIDHIHPQYAKMIGASPFVALATIGADGLDVSPRGDEPGFVVIEDERTLILPDRRGNNRIDSLRNVLQNPMVALLFLIPGVSETLRVNGRAAISVDPDLLNRFAVDGKAPRSIMIIKVERVFFQCARALIRSGLWDPERHVTRSALPSTGTLLQDISGGEIAGDEYDRKHPDIIKATLY